MVYTEHTQVEFLGQELHCQLGIRHILPIEGDPGWFLLGAHGLIKVIDIFDVVHSKNE